MARTVSWLRARPLIATLMFLGIAGLTLAGALAAAQASDSPEFCRSACHEMTPFAQAWDEGPHAKVACVDCHVDPGTPARLAHKVEATKELWVHLTGSPKFPLAEATEVPNERCIRCHEDIATSRDGFDHAAHAKEGDCQDCHATAGHEVSDAALKAAGAFNPATRAKHTQAAVATVDKGTDLPGHVPTSCSRCHDMPRSGCATCHQPDHEGTGAATKTAACETCHSPGTEFVFSHPADPADCSTCHARPAKHNTQDCTNCHKQPGASWAAQHPAQGTDCASCHTRPAKHNAQACATCHNKPGVSWAAQHPGQQSECTSCHARPAGHRSGTCGTCHKAGASWAFAHPSGRTCTQCHSKPANHRSGSCTTCHRAGVSWAFRHPSRSDCTACHARPAGHRSGSCTQCHRAAGRTWAFSHPRKATCSSCHSRPAGHRSGSCTQCHSVGRTWAFRHPSSSSCSSCHRAPSNHYGTSCASCHSPRRLWSSASFSHPRVPGGEHSYRSFACGNCHPNGYTSYSCRKCHDSSSGPSDDDD